MNYMLTRYLNIFRYFEFIRSRSIFIVLTILCIATIIINKYWLKPKLEEVTSQKSAIMARKLDEMDKLNADGTIEILNSLATVNSEGLWIHSIKIEQNTIDIIIRAFDAKIIEKYIYEVADRMHLKLENMVTKNINYKEVAENKEEDKAKQVPFAVKLYLDSIKNSGSDDKQSEDENEDDDYIAKNKIFFSYEAQIKLLASGR